MPLILVRNDITKMPVDAIVCPTDPALSGGGSLDAAIVTAAGSRLLSARKSVAPCPVGEVRTTPGFDLPCRCIIHASGPRWQGGMANESALLAQVYRACVTAAAEMHCKTLALPLISAGNLGFPRDLALRTASDTLRACLPEDMTAWLVLFDRQSALIGRQLFDSVAEYISDHYADHHASSSRSRAARREAFVREEAAPCMPSGEGDFPELVHRLEHVQESFSQSLLRAIDDRNMTDAQCYKRANLDRKLFSKIRSNVHYHPTKETALSLALALQMDLSETQSLLRKAGYALSPSDPADIIVEYFIRRGEFDILRINEVLFSFDLSPLSKG